MAKPEKRAAEDKSMLKDMVLQLQFDEPLLSMIKELAKKWPPIIAFTVPKLNIICLEEVTGPDLQPTLSMMRKDTVAWKNDDVVARMIKFESTNPLKNFPAAGITLNPGENSRAYEVRNNIAKDRYQYTIIPAYPMSGGPGEPVVFSGD